MPFCSRYTSGFVDNSALLISIFHVPSKALWASAKTGVSNNVSDAARKSFFIGILPPFEPRLL
jgi:hypothetical protein